ncbi:hypothetical protein BDZ97DRAFT_1757096 [Flammula alnicola]|nr:hypothetical protein BDZ97DRAFT_1757096 [Flammula alnicola]
MSSTSVASSLVPGKDTLLELQLIGTLLSAIAYGIVVSLFLHCLALLVGNKKHLYTHRMRIFLIVYFVVMFLMSTVALGQGLVYIIRAIFRGLGRRTEQLTHLNEPLSIPLAVWGADGFMLWRCWILYYNIPWLNRFLLYGVLMLTTLASVGSNPNSHNHKASGTLFYLTPKLSASVHISPSTPIIVTVSMTTFVNFTLTALISMRLLYHQDTMRRILGPQYGSPYFRIIAMCVESCFLIVLTCVVYIVLFARDNKTAFNGCIIPLLLLPHVCVISPLMIVYQVARGKAVTTLRPSQVVTPDIGGNDAVVSKPIIFIRPLSTAFSGEDVATHEERRITIGSNLSPSSASRRLTISLPESHV